MLKTFVKKGSYHDSVALMLLTNYIQAIDGVQKASIMMGTPANKDIFMQSGLQTPELMQASANDMVIVAELRDEALMDVILKKTDEFFQQESRTKTASAEYPEASDWETALELLPEANLAVISVAGAYAAAEADRALDNDMNVFMFSDNVTIEDEARLKRKAHEKGLAVMGPDCGTGILCGVPIAFTNCVRPGAIGIVGASGTGIQELTTIIDRLGEGVTNAVGTGGRDLAAEVGGITTLDMIDVMEQDESVKVMIVLSKPPAPEIREKVYDRLRGCKKPVVTLFLGEKPAYHEENFYHAYTLDEAARLAVSLARGEAVPDGCTQTQRSPFAPEEHRSIKAYYSGGTLASEAATLMKDALGFSDRFTKKEGFMLHRDGHIVVDLGDDVYTVGRPHPMIDPAKRIECMQEAVEDPSTGVILFDVMLGYGSHADMAGALLPAIHALQQRAEAESRTLYFVATVCGTRTDIQEYDAAVQKLQSAGVVVCETNKLAVMQALALIGHPLHEQPKPVHKKETSEAVCAAASEKLMALLRRKPDIVNIGLKSFAEVARSFGCRTVQFNWAPPAGGDAEMIRILTFLREYGDHAVDEANAEVLSKIIASQPVIRDVVPAMQVIPALAEGKTLLHAGPPMTYEQMCDPIRGSCVGAALFEGWAQTEEEARALLASGQIRLIPCHHVQAVGPMGGITSAHMPVFVVEETTEGNRAYCTMNEGIGKVLRFGAYSEEVVNRLKWMRDVLGPALGAAIRQMPDGLPVNAILAKAIAMGDEFHQRNIAASLVFLKEVAPQIVRLPLPEQDRGEVIRFLADTDQFFLNVMMATGKAVMDAARTVQEGTVVTAMCRNGHSFGIRISGMGDTWFTGPVDTPDGLYFAGYDSDDACPDMGDSAITETFGVGGMAMIAAPAVTRFVGAGGLEDAKRTSNEMKRITIDRNPNLIIPNWDFKGACLGIDARLVVERGITPVINTGIAHKRAGVGQIGAGTVHPPMECFEKAVRAYAEKLGYR